MFYCKICKSFKNTYFEERLRAAASDDFISHQIPDQNNLRIIPWTILLLLKNQEEFISGLQIHSTPPYFRTQRYKDVKISIYVITFVYMIIMVMIK